MATDKSAPARPKVGEVWKHPTGKMHPRRAVVSVTVPAGCRVPWVRYRSPTGTAFEDVPLSVWNAWAKRAVLVTPTSTVESPTGRVR